MLSHALPVNAYSKALSRVFFWFSGLILACMTNICILILLRSSRNNFLHSFFPPDLLHS